MEDRNQEVLRQYSFKIYNTYRTRGAFILETDRGLKLLRSFEGSKNRVEFENALLDILVDLDYPYVDSYVRNTANDIITEDSSGNKYVIKNWFPGEECNLRDEADVSDAATNLATLHSLLREIPLTEDQIQHNSYIDLMEVFDKRNRELRRVRSYIREKRKKNEFEMCYMGCYDEFYSQAQAATKILGESCYIELLKSAIDHRCICHGNYTYHNVIMLKTGRIAHEKNVQDPFNDNRRNIDKGEALSAAGLRKKVSISNMATTNFDKAYIGIQIMDLYHFIRKVMEKNNWDIDLGSMILDTYHSILPISKEEQKLLYILLLYPEKFWKITNFYYNGKKSWMPQRNIQKLMGIQEQAQRKSNFLQCLERTLI